MTQYNFRLTNAHFAQLLGGLKRPRAILNRAAAWAHSYYIGALAERIVVCTNCGRTTHLHLSQHTDTPALLKEPTFLYVACEGCGEAVSQSFGGLVAALPQVQAFWHQHARVRSIPPREIEAGGQSALVASFESVGDNARLDIVISRDTLRLLGIHATPASERSHHDSAGL